MTGRFSYFEDRRRGTQGSGPVRQARPGRQARLDLRAARVKLAPPSSSAGSPEPLDVLVVTATEPDPPPDREPLHWLLPTTEGNADAETARTVVS